MDKAMGLRRIVLDVLKPLRDPSIVELAERISSLRGVEAVNITVNEIDVETLSLTIIVEGEAIGFDDVKMILEEAGAVIHSVDQVVAGNRIVEVPILTRE